MRRCLLVLAMALCPSMLFGGVSELALDADVCAIKTALSGKVPDDCDGQVEQGLLRSISKDHAAASPDVSDAPRGYFIHFAFDSDNLSSTYQAHLENLSEALSSKEMSSLCLMLVGHTDAVGASTYNQRLSERRASSVKNYLVASLSMPAARFTAMGHGEEDLLAGHDPSDARNRRVEILARDADGSC